jgi:peptidoglycan/LPS O-acetylase OafA/YrhL
VALCLLLIFTIIGKPTGTLWDVPIHVTPVAVISHLLLIQDIFGTSKINYVFWSIAVEWQIYFLFPALVWSWRRYGARVTVGVALVLGYALRFGFADTRLVRAAPQYIGCFALGMVAAFIGRSSEPGYARVRDRLPWEALCLLALGAVGVMSWVWGFARAADRFQFLDLPAAIAAMCMLVATSRPGSRAAAALGWKPLAFIGTFSYSVYLIHAPLLQVLWQYVLRPAGLGSGATFAALMGPGAVAILGASYAFFKVLEEPFMRQAKVSARPQPDAAPELRAT